MSELKPISECKTVAELLADKSRWTQGVEARRADRTVVAPDDADAVCFCAFGAIEKIYGPSVSLALGPYEKLDIAMNGSNFCQVSGFNDTHTYEEVYAAVLQAGI